jgi:hypothetical protein
VALNEPKASLSVSSGKIKSTGFANKGPLLFQG